MSNTQQVELDEDRDSRTIAALGRDVLRRMIGSNVLVSGMDGLGCEIAKNVMLAGVRNLTIHDETKATWLDYSSQFYLSEADIGKNRATACKANLHSLNPTVAITVLDGPLTNKLLENVTVAVFVNTPEHKLVEYNKFCREKNIKFILANCNGVFGRCFCDFGNNFVVHDVNGENPHGGVVVNISNGNPAVVTCSQEEGLIEFGEGEYVTFQDVEGMTELNGHGPVKIIETAMYAFKIDLDTTKFGKFKREDLSTYTTCVETKMPKTLNFRSLEQCLTDPGELLLTDFAKFDRSPHLHLGYRALDAYHKKHGKAVAPRNAEAFAEVLALAQEVNKGMKDPVEKIDENLLKTIVNNAQPVLMPMASIFGGILGQEVMKAVSNKLHPLFQWMYLDSTEALPPADTPDSEFVPEGNRYDGQVMIFGKELQNRVRNLKYFIVGSGALGCEMLKNFAMMGVATGENGLVTLTDDDIIEKSNLSRQFLFRNHHVKEFKSTTARDSVQQMNPQFKVNALQERVQPASENIFNRKFWEELDGVANALDNVKARRYVDNQCVFYRKSLLESGTMGTKCNMQVVLPHLTANYGSRADPETKEAPECALHNFPHNINHCLSLGRSEFIGRFTTAPANAAQYVKDADYVKELQGKIWDASGAIHNGKINGLANAQEALEELGGVMECLVTNKPDSFDDCVAWARLSFEEYFSNKIKQLVFNFPADAKNSSGGSFWSPPKRFPSAIKFDENDPEHMRYIMAAANLKATTYGIALSEDATKMKPAAFKDALAKVKVPEFAPKEGIKIDTGDTAQSNQQAATAERAAKRQKTNEPTLDTPDQVKATLAELPPKDKIMFEPFSNEFEKDDDSNFHMDFIGSFANLRGRNYNITEVDKLQAKLIAGRIIPALATTTSAVTGFVCMELMKVVQKKKFEEHRDLQANLALPEYMLYEPEPAKVLKPRTEKKMPDPINHPDYVEEEVIDTVPKEGFTVWDRIDVKEGDITLKQFCAYWKAKHNIEVTSITVGITAAKAVILYNPLFPKTKDNLDKKISALWAHHGGLDLPAGDTGMVVLDCLFENADGEDVETPTVVVHYK